MIMVVTVGVELVIGFAFAYVMWKIIFARGVIRTSILIPYGIITVVSAFAWQFAFSLNNGFVNGWLPFVGQPTTTGSGGHWSAMSAIMRLRDLEDDAVHVAAAARRPVADLRGHGRGRAGRRGERGGSGSSR